MKLSGDSVKQFLVNHVEKFGFGLALAMVALFVYRGYSLEGYQKTPVELREVASQASQQIANDTWTEKLQQEKLDPQREFSSEVKESTVPIDYTGYVVPTPWKPVNKIPIVRRNDPDVLPPLKLEVDVKFGALAIASKAPDPLASLEPAPRPEPPQQKKKKPRTTRRPRGGPGEEGSEMGMFYGEGGEGGEDGMDMGEEMMMGEGMFGEGGAMGGASGQRTFPNPPPYWVLPTGAVGSGGMGPATPGGAGAAGGVPGMAPKGHVVVAVKALVPFQEQFDEYERTLRDAIDYQPQRDRPQYLGFVVQRAEVGDDPAAAPDWQPLAGTNTALRQQMRWKGRGRELTDPKYTLPNVLTMDPPPLLMRDADFFGLHSEVPRRSDKPAKVDDKPAEDELPEPVPGGLELPMGVPRPGTTAGSGYGDEMGAGEMMGPEAAMMMGEEGMGMEGYGAEEGGSYDTFGTAMNMTEHKLLRFYDTTAVPGKRYRYRFQLIVTDPNRPQNPALDLNERTLEPEVVARLEEVKKSEAALAKQTKGRMTRIYYRYSDWSDPSPVVEAPPTRRLLAGGSEVTSRFKKHATASGGVIHKIEPVAKFCAVIWDSKFSTDVPYSTDARLGSVMNNTTDLTVVHPITLSMKLAKQYAFRSNAVVVDIRGGDNVGLDDKDPQAAPAQVAAIDPYGNLVVRDEVDDLRDYRIFAYVEDVPPPATEGGYDSGMEEGDAMMEMEMGYGEDFDDGGGGRRRRGFDE